MDIVERLRDLAKNHDDYGPYDHAADPYLLQEAAAEIERLRAELGARDGEIAAWLRGRAALADDSLEEQVASDAFVMIATVIEMGAYKGETK